MSYTKEQRAANAAKAAAAAEAAGRAQQQAEPAAAPDTEPKARPAVPQARTRNDDRSRAFDEIVDRHNKESGLSGDDQNAAPAQTVEPPTTEPRAPTTEATDGPVAATHTDGATEPETPKATKTVKQTVDGKEYDVPAEEIEEAGGERAWRIERASKNRLEESKAALAESRRAQAEAMALAQALLQRSTQVQPESPKMSDIQLINAIRAGNEEEATAALKEWETRLRGPQIDQNAIMARTLTEVKKNAAVERFQTEFADIVGNPLLMRLAVSLDQDGMAQAYKAGAIGPQFDFSDHYRRIGNQVRALLPRPSQPQQDPAAQAASTAGNPSPATSDREARKASTIVNLPTASSARAVLPEEEKPESREETLAAMGERVKGRRPNR